MNSEKFNQIVDRRKSLITSVLQRKAAEYVQGGDRLYNFKRAATITGDSPEKALLGMLMKHIVSVLDIIEKIEKAHQIKNTEYDVKVSEDSNDRISKTIFTQDYIDEKFGDVINYFILLEALIHDQNHVS